MIGPQTKIQEIGFFFVFLYLSDWNVAENELTLLTSNNSRGTNDSRLLGSANLFRVQKSEAVHLLNRHRVDKTMLVVVIGILVVLEPIHRIIGTLED